MSFPTVPLKSVTHLNPETLGEDTEPSQDYSYAEISDVALGEPVRWQDPTNFASLPSRARRLVRDDDILVSTVRTYLRAVARVDRAPKRALASTGFAVFRPARVEARYLGYALQETHFVDSVVAQSVGVSYPAVNAGDVARLHIPAPPRGVQRQIADYLDHETAEIDAFIADLVRLRDLSVEEREVLRSSLLLGSDPNDKFAPLKRLARVTVGIVVEPSRYYTGNGVPALRGLNVSPEQLSTAGVVQITLAGHTANSKSELATGDVVVVRTGQAGAAAVVPPECDGWNAIDLLIVKPHSTLRGEYLAALINSREVQSKIQHGSVGAIQAHFNVESLRNLSVPFIPPSEQAARFVAWSKKSMAVQGAVFDIEAAIALAKERRAALITAAVTGQIDVTTKQTPAVESIQTAIEESR